MEHTERAAEKRRLRIYATDPMSGRRAPYRIAIEIDNEIDLKAGPRGELVEVWDYDAGTSNTTARSTSTTPRC